MSGDVLAGESAAPAARLPEPGKKKRSFLRELPVLVATAFVLSLLIRTFLAQPFFIPSESMEKTLHGCPGCTGDRILVNKLVYRFHDPRPGDVIVFRGPPSWAAEVPAMRSGNSFYRTLGWIGGLIGLPQPSEKDFTKRVIAVGGQTVACCDAQGRVTVNGTPLDEPYIYENSPIERRRFGPVVVPNGRLWVMGDHRSVSADSRFHVSDRFHGTISVNDVIGKAFVIIWPPARWNTVGGRRP